MKSELCKSVFKSAFINPTSFANSSSIGITSYPMIFMFNARASLPNLFPILPKPIIPKYFPRSSVPFSSFLSHCPSLIALSPLPVCLARDNIKPKTNSATAFIAPSTALITRMSFVLAAS